MSSETVHDLVDRLGTPRVLIIGDIILDRYITGDVTRISPEAPIPVLAARHTEERLGGAGNVGANLRSMGADVEVIGMLGDDANGRTVLELLDEIGAETGRCVRDAGRPTIEKARLVSGVNQMLRVDWEEPHPIAEPFERQVLAALDDAIPAAQAIILSDYGKGLCTPGILAATTRIARAHGIPVLVDPKGRDYTRYRGATLVTPNRKEAEEALGRKLDQLGDLPAAARELIALAELDSAVITLGAEGIFYLEKNGESGRVPTMARAVFDVTGAGDTVISNLALGLAAGFSLEDAVRLANQAAGIVVGRRGAASVTREEMRAAGGAGISAGKVVPREGLTGLLAEWRRMGHRVVFTNGCFDLLHRGHVDYLRQARMKGDKLIVGVNDDASVTRLKGPTRPINSVDDRMHVLAALEMVDAVTSFGEDTPADLIERVTPDVLVKGEDWRDKGVVGREWVESHGGVVHLVPLTEGRSTTNMVDAVAKSLERAGE